MTVAPVRVGLVGCGRLAEHGYVPAAQLTPAVQVVAVADPDATRRRLVAGQVPPGGPAVSTHPDAATLLGRADIDALVLANPAEHHVTDAERAVAAGVPVLVEKPPAPDAAGARRLVELGDTVRVAFNRRFDPAVVRLVPAVPHTGSVDVDVTIRYRRASWQAVTVRDDVLADLAPHAVDLVRWLAGTEVRSVACTRAGHDAAVLRLDTDRGHATIEVSAEHVHEERIVVRGPHGAVVAEHRAGGPLAAITGRLTALAARVRGRQAPHPLVASLAAQLEAFAHAARGEDAGALGTGVDGVAAMVVVDAARTSAAAGGAPVPVPDLQERRSC